MADLIGRDGSRDRGQIILIAGFTLAVTFLALALIANTAIFTENLATRGDTTGSSDALLLRHEIEESAEDTIAYLNENNVSDLPEKAETNIEENLSVQTGVKSARQGRVVAAEVVDDSAVVDARLSQENDSRSYLNATGQAEWVLANDTEEIHNATFKVTNANGTRENESYQLFINDSDPGSSKYWRMSVYNETILGVNEYTITVEDNVGTLSNSSCNPGLLDGNFTINVTGGQVEDGDLDNCSNTLDNDNYTSFASGKKNISYSRGQNITGNYSISLGNTTVKTENFNESAEPVADVEIEKLRIAFTYETDSLRYETEFEVAVDDD